MIFTREFSGYEQIIISHPLILEHHLPVTELVHKVEYHHLFPLLFPLMTKSESGLHKLTSAHNHAQQTNYQTHQIKPCCHATSKPVHLIILRQKKNNHSPLSDGPNPEKITTEMRKLQKDELQIFTLHGTLLE
jgi:hypothetical protein